MGTPQTTRQLLAVPANIHQDGQHFTGLILLKANPQNGFQEIGRVSHRDLAAQVFCRTRNQPPGCEPAPYWYPWSNLRRSFFISHDNQHHVYSLSNVGLKINDLHTPENQLAAVPFF